MLKSDVNAFPKWPVGMTCVLCGTSEEAPCVLVPIAGTEDDGIVEVTPVHLPCLGALMNKPTWHPDKGVMTSFLRGKEM